MQLDIKQVADNWREGFKKHDINLKNSSKKEERVEKNKNDIKKWWNKLSNKEREDAFLSVCQLMCQGELDLQGSYRYIMHVIFGFEKEMYDIGINYGYMEIHNHLYGGKELSKMSDAKKIVIDTKDKQHVIDVNNNQNLTLRLLDDDQTLNITINNLKKPYDNTP